MEQISTITRKLNELTDIDQVLEEIFDYFFYTYGLSFAAFQLIDRAKEEIVPYKMSQFADPEKHTLFQTFNVKISSSSGSMCKAYDTKKPVFIKDANSAIQTSEIDRIIVEQFKINSYIQVPLLIQKEVFGIMMIGIYLELSNSSYDALKRFCNQITVAIYNTFLLKEANQEKEKSDLLLLNILPRKIADELKLHGQVEPTFYESMSVMFTDFEKFTQIAEKLTPHELVKELDTCFTQFDKISGKFKLEKLKTIGDSFMCAGGIPNINNTHAIDCSLAALEILSFMNDMRSINESLQKAYWEIRIGIHSGPVMAGVVGERKFAYDIWGDTVNTASRMESSGTSGKINISHSSYELIKEYFECEYRGEIKAKNKGMIKMFYLNRIKKEFSKDENGFVPNEIFWDKYNAKNYNKSIDVALLD
jgi:class 3 adenylate cyclase